MGDNPAFKSFLPLSPAGWRAQTVIFPNSAQLQLRPTKCENSEKGFLPLFLQKEQQRKTRCEVDRLKRANPPGDKKKVKAGKAPVVWPVKLPIKKTPGARSKAGENTSGIVMSLFCLSPAAFCHSLQVLKTSIITLVPN